MIKAEHFTGLTPDKQKKYKKINNFNSKKATLDTLTKHISKYYNLNMGEVITAHRIKKIVRARQMCFYFAKYYYNLELVFIGDYFNRSHATVIHGSKKILVENTLYDDTIKEVKDIKDIINANNESTQE